VVVEVVRPVVVAVEPGDLELVQVYQLLPVSLTLLLLARVALEQHLTT
jgi:hypothetical protein